MNAVRGDSPALLLLTPIEAAVIFNCVTATTGFAIRNIINLTAFTAENCRVAHDRTGNLDREYL
jgi:hypothetical protein